MRKKAALGPDPRKAFTYQELPIGSTITGLERDLARTGTWRFYRPVFAPGSAPCRQSCAARVDIAAVMAKLKKKRFEEACLDFMLENPFPGTCARLCNRPCENACNREKVDGPISVRAMEEFIFSAGFRLRPVVYPGRERRKIAIVGAGIIGLSSAYFLARLGYRPIVFRGDGLESASGRDRRYDGVMAEEIDAIVEQGVVIWQDRWTGNKTEEFEAVYLSVSQTAGRDPDRGAISREGIFERTKGAPDCQGVDQAIEEGKRMAVTIDAHLRGKGNASETRRSDIGEKGGISSDLYQADGSNRGDFEVKVTGGVSQKADDEELQKLRQRAVEEAMRCLNCGACTGCGQCILYCPEGALSRSSVASRTIIVDYAFCKGCGICRNECPKSMFVFKKEEGEWE